jgi:hypothetical protein
VNELGDGAAQLVPDERPERRRGRGHGLSLRREDGPPFSALAMPNPVVERVDARAHEVVVLGLKLRAVDVVEEAEHGSDESLTDLNESPLFVLNGALRASIGQVSDTPADLAVHGIVDHSRPLRSQPLPSTGREIVGGGCVVLSGIVIPKEGDELPNMDRERFDVCIKRRRPACAAP